MKKTLTMALLALISVNLYADIEIFDESQLKQYLESNSLYNSTISFNNLKLPFDMIEYSKMYINKQVGETESDKIEGAEKLSSYCYDALKKANISLSMCLKGEITPYSKSFIVYQYSLIKRSE